MEFCRMARPNPDLAGYALKVLAILSRQALGPDEQIDRDLPTRVHRPEKTENAHARGTPGIFPHASCIGSGGLVVTKLTALQL
jgi:hypothetical protein